VVVAIHDLTRIGILDYVVVDPPPLLDALLEPFALVLAKGGSNLGPSAKVAGQLNVDVLHYGPTEARYTCVCDEVGESEGSVEFEVRERGQVENR
jgi:hypothetical protein